MRTRLAVVLNRIPLDTSLWQKKSGSGLRKEDCDAGFFKTDKTHAALLEQAHEATD
jgi:hypothetical protein